MSAPVPDKPGYENRITEVDAFAIAAEYTMHANLEGRAIAMAIACVADAIQKVGVEVVRAIRDTAGGHS